MEMKAIWPGWEVVRKIGSGSFGNVYEIERDMFGEKEKAAMKVLSIPHNPDEVDDYRSQGYTDADITEHYHQCLQQIIQEYSLMAKIKGHSNVVSCEDVQYVPREDGVGWHIYIKMELLTPLMKSLDRVANEEEIVRLGADICNALVLCKERNIIHRDIKPQNIFVSDTGSYKLGDFGIAKTVERTSGGTRIGTYKYMAPEVYNNQPYGAAADLYSLGLVLYWLLNEKRTPFLPVPPQMPTAAMEEQAGLRRFRGEPIPEPKNGSDELKRIVLKACAASSADRYASAAEMLQDLRALKNVSAAVFPPVAASGPIGGAAVAAKTGAAAMDTVVLDSQDTVLLDQSAVTPARKAAKPVPAPPEQPEKKKKTALWIVLGAAVVGIIILLLLLKSCDGRPVGEGNSTTAPTTGVSTGAPTTGVSTGAPTTGTTTTGTPTTDTTTVPTTQPTSAPTLPPEVVQITVNMDFGYTSTAADGQASMNAYGVNLQEKTVAQGDKITLPTPSRPGYTFDGWYTAETGGEKLGASVVANKKTTYYARWTGKMENVTYHAAGGTFSNGKETVVISTQNGGNYVLPDEIPTKPGYNFMGWTDGESMVTEDRVKGYVYEQTFTAMWGEGEYAYNVECVAKYQDGTRTTIRLYSVINKIDGTYTITPPAITGYQTPAAKSVKWDTTTAKTITFEYVPNKVGGTVIYSFGTSNDRQTVFFEYNSTQSFTAKSIAGYTPNKQTQVIAAWGVNGTPTVTFTYKANSYQLVLYYNGGSGSGNVTVVYGGTYANLPTPTRSGYTFDGWYTKSGVKINKTDKVTTASNQELTARWTQNEAKWVLADQVPSNALIVDEKWVYTKTETVTSAATSMAGWTQTGSTWQQTGTGVYYYGPKRKSNDVFNTAEPLYTKYNLYGAAKTSTETATTKRVYSDSVLHTYIYWHWTGNDDYNNISNIQNEELSTGKKATLWEACESTEKVTKTKGEGFLDPETNIRHYTYEKDFGSSYRSILWWRNEVYKQTYTDYQKIFTYQRVTNGVESETAVTAGNGISNVQHWVCYREA